jgi:hypothetical protein
MPNDIPGNQAGYHTTKTRWYVSHDRGKTWKQTLELLEPGSHFSADNVCEFGPGGVAYAISLSGGGSNPNKTVVHRSLDGGLTWDKNPATFPFIDREAFAADNTGGKFQGRLYVIGQADIPGVHGKETRAIQLYRSLDGGRSLHRSAFRFGSGALIAGQAAVLSDGTFIAPMFMSSMPAGQERSSGPLLVVVRSTDGGETLEPEIKVAEPSVFGMPSLAVDGGSATFKDRLYVVWRDSSRGRPHVLLAVSTDKGQSWSSPRIVDDTPPHADGSGPDVVLPVVKVNKDGVVGVSWYDKRDVPNNMGWDMRFAASLDGGDTFTPSVRVSAKSSVLDTKTEVWPVSGDEAVGTRDGVEIKYGVSTLTAPYTDTNGMAVGADGTFHPVWVDNRTGIPQVWTAAVRVQGPVVRHGAPELATLVDVSDKITIRVFETAFDRATGMLTGIYRLRNTSRESIRGPLKLRLVSLDGEVGPVRAHKADNNVEGVGAVWDFTALLGDGVLAPDEESRGRKLTFTVPNPRLYGPKGQERGTIARPVFRVLASEVSK